MEYDYFNTVFIELFKVLYKKKKLIAKNENKENQNTSNGINVSTQDIFKFCYEVHAACQIVFSEMCCI